MIAALRRLSWPCALVLLLGVELALMFPGLLAGSALASSQEGWAVSDLLDVAVPLQSYVAERLRRGEFPTWYPRAFLGTRLSSMPEAVPWYLPSTLLFALVAPGRAAAWSTSVHLILAGLGGAALARRLGASRAGATLTALVLCGGLWLPAHARQYNLLLTASWFPWIWWATEGLLRRPDARASALLALVTGASLLAGHAQMSHHAAVALTVWVLARVASDAELRPRRHLARVAVAGCASAILALAIGSPHLLPVAELAAQGVRRGTFADGIARFAPRAEDLLAFAGGGSLRVDPLRLWLDRPLWWEHISYIGRIPLALGLVGLVRSSPSSPRGVRTQLGAVLVVALAISVSTAWGWSTRLAALLPGMALFRFHGRFMWIATVALAVLAAFGVDAVRALPAVSSRARAAALAFAAGLAIAVLDLTAVVVPLCPTASAALLTREPRSSVALRGAIADAQRGSVLQLASPHDRNLVGLVAGWGRHPDILAEAREFLPPQYAGLFGWNNVCGYVGITTAAVQSEIGDQFVRGALRGAIDSWLDAPSAGGLDRLLYDASLLGVRWVLSAVPIDHPHLRLVHSSVGHVVQVHAYRLDPWVSAAHFVDADGAPLATARPTHSRADRPEHLEVTGEHPTASTLRLPIAWGPHWRYAVDGGRWLVPPRPARLAMQVPWPAGRHTLTLRHDGRPDAILLGCSVLALLVSVTLLLRPRRP